MRRMVIAPGDHGATAVLGRPLPEEVLATLDPVSRETVVAIWPSVGEHRAAWNPAMVLCIARIGAVAMANLLPEEQVIKMLSMRGTPPGVVGELESREGLRVLISTPGRFATFRIFQLDNAPTLSTTEVAQA